MTLESNPEQNNTVSGSNFFFVGFAVFAFHNKINSLTYTFRRAAKPGSESELGKTEVGMNPESLCKNLILELNLEQNNAVPGFNILFVGFAVFTFHNKMNSLIYIRAAKPRLKSEHEKL